MMKVRIKCFMWVLMSIIMLGCAPTQTVNKPEPIEPGIDNKVEAEKNYSIAFEYYKQGKYDEAITNLNTAIKFDKKFYSAYILLAKCHLKKRDIVAAESAYNKAKTIDPRDSRAYEGLGALYTEQKRYSDAISQYESGLMVDSTSVELLNGIAYVYSKLKDLDRALFYYEKSLTLDPENLSTMYAVADVYIDLDMSAKAIAYLEELVQKKPSNIDVRKKYLEVLIDLKMYKKAKEQLNYLIEQDPSSYFYHLQLGLIYQREKSWTLAENEYKAAKTLAPDNAVPLLYLADLMIARGRYGDAEAYVKQAQKIDPASSYAYVLLGDIALRRGIAYLNAWNKNKSKNNCPALKNALSYFRSAITYYGNATGDETYGSYARNEINRANNYTKSLEEDKWFYCKE